MHTRTALAVMAVALALAGCGGGDEGPRELSIDGAGVVIHARAVGPDDDATTTIITVHGGPGLSLEAMAPYDVLAGSGRQVVGYDQRGAGTSTTPADGDFGLDAQVADLDAVRRGLGADRIALIGASWGGAVAAAYAAAHPDRVSALVLVGAVPLDVDAFLAGQARFRAHVNALQEQSLLPDPLPGDVDGSCTAALDAVLPAYLASPSDDVDVPNATCTGATSRATYAAFVAPGAVEPYANAAPQFGGRVLAMMGVEDPFGLEWLERTVELFAGATVVERRIADAGHLVALERPTVALGAIDELLAAEGG